jgi:hypothetical protein
MNNVTNYLSSSIDWCESNFIYNIFIAEFWNSITSLSVSMFGLIGMFFYPKIKMLYFTMIPIGLTSFYFHATLSLLGQLLDEVSIVICIIVAGHYINNNIYKICNKYLMYVINIIQIILMFTFPEYNRLILFMYGFYFWKFLRHVKMTYCEDDVYYITLSEILFASSVITWLIDFIFCIKIFNFHALWHILIGFTGYYLFKAIYILSYNQRLVN